VASLTTPCDVALSTRDASDLRGLETDIDWHLI